MTTPAKDATADNRVHGTRAAAHRNLAVAAGRQLHSSGLKLDTLVDVDAPTPSDGDVLTSDGAGTWRAHAPDKPAIAKCTDVDLTTPPGGGQGLVWVPASNAWIPADPTLASLTDVTVTGAIAGSLLTSDGAGAWRAQPSASYTKAEVDTAISTVVAGIEHGVAVTAIQNAPPASPVVDEVYIVGTTPTGLFAGHANALAVWSGTAWAFTSPQAKEAHLVEDQSSVFSWMGTAWVKVASGSTAAGASSQLFMLGDIKHSILTETQFKAILGPVESLKWTLADGRNVAGSDYATLTGSNTVPDLRGAYLRMAGQNTNASWNGGVLGGWQEDTTRMPRNTPFTATAARAGNHYHASGVPGYNDDRGSIFGRTDITAGGKETPNYDGGAPKTPLTSTDGDHTHTVTVAGGDTFTAPVHFSMNTFIKIN